MRAPLSGSDAACVTYTHGFMMLNPLGRTRAAIAQAISILRGVFYAARHTPRLPQRGSGWPSAGRPAFHNYSCHAWRKDEHPDRR
jgi:hypothetical protein